MLRLDGFHGGGGRAALGVASHAESESWVAESLVSINQVTAGIGSFTPPARLTNKGRAHRNGGKIKNLDPPSPTHPVCTHGPRPKTCRLGSAVKQSGKREDGRQATHPSERNRLRRPARKRLTTTLSQGDMSRQVCRVEAFPVASPPVFCPGVSCVGDSPQTRPAVSSWAQQHQSPLWPESERARVKGPSEPKRSTRRFT
ncbi:uncharacterized protein UV8b_06170 [Ustilaginoidea virens]|uniref:Uncharacterized protein n=1 Tax=Ustilaginoidea virens TaxID=1159556 RepID=A0A8E5HVD2_USTVR|nr:uncharacterized protein UV8b_06170 [Ustilaginoidea virens]QUC21929.1 hypothetical protein UV8b_06170 [Ustilaginoidea virens]